MARRVTTERERERRSDVGPGMSRVAARIPVMNRSRRGSAFVAPASVAGQGPFPALAREITGFPRVSCVRCAVAPTALIVDTWRASAAVFGHTPFRQNPKLRRSTEVHLWRSGRRGRRFCVWAWALILKALAAAETRDCPDSR